MTTNPNDKKPADVPLRTDVPLDMHPGALGHFAKVLDQDGQPGQGAYKTAREALVDAYKAFAKINDAERAVQPPRKMSPASERRIYLP